MARKNDQPKSVFPTILLALAAGIAGGGDMGLKPIKCGIVALDQSAR